MLLFNSYLEIEQVIAEQRNTLTKSMIKKRTPKTTQSQSNQGGPSSHNSVDAKIRNIYDFKITTKN